ncbi:energy-coupling factor transporter transmembrane component T family protein [Bordetella trematum]|uniref:energy-coupling factor transporter transmembrane component T family protein n=1 Tax=Bordetella trematum TaxID=123899 RepID=UPI0039896B33
MMAPLYVPGSSWLHRLPAALKLAALVSAGIVLFAWQSLPGMGAACLAAWLLVAITGVRAGALWRQVRGMVWILLAVGLFTFWMADARQALLVVARAGTLIGLALAVTLSTPVPAMLAVIERVLQPLSRWIDPARVTLALALCLRFIPEIWRNYEEIREAQAARGLGHHPLALLVPLIVRTLKRAEEVAQAIDARS